MWAVILLGVVAVGVVVAMCSGEKPAPTRVIDVIFVDMPAKSSNAGETILGVLLSCGVVVGAGYAVFLLLPYLLGLLGIVIVLAIITHIASANS